MKPPLPLLRNVWNAVTTFLDRLLSDPGPGTPEDGKRDDRRFRLFLLLWFLFWSILPMLCIGNLYIDISENIQWGRHFQFGYDKNPYVGPWLTYAFYRISGGWTGIHYLLSQIFIASGAFSAAALARELFGADAKASRIAILLMLMTPFCTIWAGEFNDDIMDFGFWSLLILFAARAMKRQTAADWLLAGLFAGLAVMTKYLAALLFLSLLVPMLFTEEGRRSWKDPAFYAACGLVFLMVLPNLLWLAGNRFIAFTYALERANMEEEAFARIIQPARMLLNIVWVLFPPVMLYLLCFARRRAAREETGGAFAKIYLASAAGGPVLLLFLFSIAAGAEIGLPWMTPCFVFPGLLLIQYFPPADGIRRRNVFLIALLLVSGGAAAYHLNSHLYRHGYVRRNSGYESFPGKISAEDLTRVWRQRFGTPLPFVIGDRTEACNIALYSPDKPEPFFSANTLYSQWIDPEEVRRKGALVVWTENTPSLPEDLEGKLTPAEDRAYPRAVVPWFRALAGEPKKQIIHFAFLPPSPDIPKGP